MIYVIKFMVTDLSTENFPTTCIPDDQFNSNFDERNFFVIPSISVILALWSCWWILCICRDELGYWKIDDNGRKDEVEEANSAGDDDVHSSSVHLDINTFLHDWESTQV